MANLSDNAQKLYSFLKTNGAAHETTCIDFFYPAPVYGSTREEKIQYWQHDVNYYGHANNRPVGNGETMDFVPTGNYAREISAAYQELRKAGLAGERNNGTNSYTFFAK